MVRRWQHSEAHFMFEQWCLHRRVTETSFKSKAERTVQSNTVKATSIPALQKAAQKRKSSLSGLLDGVEKQGLNSSNTSETL